MHPPLVQADQKLLGGAAATRLAAAAWSDACHKLITTVAAAGAHGEELHLRVA